MELDRPLHLEVIVGSVRVKRFAPVVVDWFLERARARDTFDTAVLDLADTSLPQDLSHTAEVEAFTERIGGADAFVVVTSEYNHGYPAALKTALDTVKYEWRAKPIGFVAYGGMSGGLRAVEQLRQVAAELHMVSIREAVSFHQARKHFDPDDGPANDAAQRMLTQLAWWADALRTQREHTPYPG
ncbi:NADPH-dependent FMN reductase [Prescottella agglutinans]|uniref:NAD(P)H-dependent FMN reductase n=1 Tax=Prescottella agglutinans TaxID=1644129 RepID=A0ABT6M4E1_9NOCA|nr:NAD(P)H-dependent oxidoreductase [Prescottella agglutinans]MDH6279181.1 NAD(P)H-dependent FMN reductase [Prescottella agglutinans]